MDRRAFFRTAIAGTAAGIELAAEESLTHRVYSFLWAPRRVEVVRFVDVSEMLKQLYPESLIRTPMTMTPLTRLLVTGIDRAAGVITLSAANG